MTPSSSAVSTASQKKTCRYRRCSWASSSAVCAMKGPLDQIDEREHENPDEIDEVPVERDDLDRVAVVRRVRALERAHEDAGEVHDAREDVAAVEAGQDEERRTEVVLGDRLPLVDDEVRPLVRLEAEEEEAAADRE